jgi:8-oxo-dGTP diphosphatase
MGEGRAARPSSLALNEREQVLRAAGGVVARRRGDGRTEVLLVHRPKYDDWTFPKGKALPRESDEECALREVEEETSLQCALGPELPTVAYLDRGGRQKVVRYWTMSARNDLAEPRDEVDEVRWLPPEQASSFLSYDRDRVVLAAFVDGSPT